MRGGPARRAGAAGDTLAWARIIRQQRFAGAEAWGPE